MDQKTEPMRTSLKRLCLQPGISTREDSSGIVSLISDMCREYGADTVDIDTDGNVVATVGTGPRTILLEAHLDEIGFLVTDIRRNGSAILSPCGVVKGERIAGSKAYVLRTGVEGKLTYNQGEGISFKSFGSEMDIMAGDVVSFKRVFVADGDIVNATALDNRVGCAALLETLRLFKEKNTPGVRLVLVFSLGEETDTTSVRSAVTTYKPDLFIVVDAAYATPIDFDFNATEENIPTIGGGCAIQYKGQGFNINPETVAAVEKIAREQNIRVQREGVNGNKGKTNFTEFVTAGTDSGIVINIPTQNQHRAVSTTNICDAQEAVRLLLAIVSTPVYLDEILRLVPNSDV